MKPQKLYRLYLAEPVLKDGQVAWAGDSLVYGVSDTKLLRNITHEQAKEQIAKKGKHTLWYLQEENPPQKDVYAQHDWRANWVKQMDKDYGLNDYDKLHYN
ncbi:MAG: hypothetical protein NC218_03540 [Acetobacter sp.]|nr:hypothetical protein [Acetobacter sp.]